MAQKKSGSGDKPSGSNVVSPEVFRALSVLTSRANLAARGGITFSGDRDLYNVFGYRRTLVFADSLAKYSRQDIAVRIVNAPADALWKEPPEVVTGGTFDKVWLDLVKTTKLWNRINRMDKLVGIGRFAILLIGYDDVTDLEQPVEGRENRKILYLQPYSENSVSIKEFDSDIRSARYGLPKMYKIDVSDPAFTSSSSQVSIDATRSRSLTVHHSRVLHVAENTLENDVIGIPRLQSVFNLLDDLLKVVGGAAEMFWLSGRQGMQVDVDKEMDLTPEDVTALSDEIDDYQHQLRRVIRTRGVKIHDLGSKAPDPKASFDTIIALMSAATGMPQRILLGSEAGQLASEQDRANWADRVEERQISYGNDVILFPLIQTFQDAGVLPEGDVEINWPSAFKLSPIEEDQSRAQFARSAVNLSRTSQTGEITSFEEARERLGLPRDKPPGDTFIGDQVVIAPREEAEMEQEAEDERQEDRGPEARGGLTPEEARKQADERSGDVGQRSDRQA